MSRHSPCVEPILHGGVIYWGERCLARFDNVEMFRGAPHCPLMFAAMMGEPWPGYTGPNILLRGYYVREVKRSGTERHSVYLEIVGTGRTLRIGRKAFERERARA
jgi:hypothetical protein